MRHAQSPDRRRRADVCEQAGAEFGKSAQGGAAGSARQEDGRHDGRWTRSGHQRGTLTLCPQLEAVEPRRALLARRADQQFSSRSRQTLYESDPPEEDRIAALQKVIPSAEAHETILRAWQLHRRHKREAHSAELARKYNAMRQAVDFLEETDKSLWEKAVGGKKYQNVDQSGATNARLEGLVPREMRVPTELPAGKMWDYEWKAPQQQQEPAPKRPQA